MNNKQSSWETEKKKLAEKIKEITLIWRISYEDRNKLIDIGINTWDNLYLLKNLYELKYTNTREIQERIIHMNSNNNLIIEPRNITRGFKEILKSDDIEFILDIESVLNLETKGSYFNNDINEELPNICIIGLIIINKDKFVFKDFTIDELTIESEKLNIINWLNFISKYDKIKIYHWGHAEKSYLENIHKRFPNIKIPNMILIDLLEYYRKEPIIIKDCFNFSLKTIGKNMYKHGLIKSTWSDTDNGLDAMIKFKEICLRKDKNIPLKRYNEISEIIEYNKMDCVILKEILEYLRYKYL
jgi:predicted RecB family nuclease